MKCAAREHVGAASKGQPNVTGLGVAVGTVL